MRSALLCPNAELGKLDDFGEYWFLKLYPTWYLFTYVICLLNRHLECVRTSGVMMTECLSNAPFFPGLRWVSAFETLPCLIRNDRESVGDAPLLSSWVWSWQAPNQSFNPLWNWGMGSHRARGYCLGSWSRYKIQAWAYDSVSVVSARLWRNVSSKFKIWLLILRIALSKAFV